MTKKDRQRSRRKLAKFLAACAEYAGKPRARDQRDLEALHSEALRLMWSADSFLASPEAQALAVEELERCRIQFYSGDRAALLMAVRSCAMHVLPMPPWVACAVSGAISDVMTGQARSLDEAFGAPFKGQCVKTRRRRAEKQKDVWMEVGERNASGQPIDVGMFERIGNALGIGRTVAMEYYYGKRKRPPKKTR